MKVGEASLLLFAALLRTLEELEALKRRQRPEQTTTAAAGSAAFPAWRTS